MNKTVTANISGLVFHIEVDAYDKLNSYLNKIRSYFQNSDERDEIMADIEARIAELFTSKLNDANQVVREKDVDEVMEIMGKPEQYLQDDEESKEQNESRSYSASGVKSPRRLFRDPDDRVLGGVCSGLSHYFGLDPIWIRLIFILIFLLGGSGFLIYIILWIVIPEAKTAAQKLQMKGEPVNIDSIGKAFEEGAKKVNEKFQNLDTNGFGQKLEKFFEQVFHVLGVIVTGFLKFIGKILGIFLFVVGILLAFSLLSGMLTSETIVYAISPEGVFSLDRDVFLSIFASESQLNLAKYTLLVLLGAPVLAFIYGGVKLLFGFKKANGIGTALGIIWLLGLGSAIIIGLQLGGEFRSQSKVTEYSSVDSKYNEYVLEMNLEDVPGEEIIAFEDDQFILSMDKGKLYKGLPELDIIKSYKDSIQLRIEKTSRGSSKRSSLRMAKDINYNFQQQGELLSFDSFISFDRQQKIRGQEVQLTLLLPIGKSIYLDESLRELIFHIDNVTNTHDNDMIGRKWIMLEEGLTCLDCPDIEGVSSSNLELEGSIEM